MDRKKNHSGITLIELLVVMVIIAMFATIVGQRLFRNVEKARQTTAKAQISEFESVLDAFRRCRKVSDHRRRAAIVTCPPR